MRMLAGVYFEAQESSPYKAPPEPDSFHAPYSKVEHIQFFRRLWGFTMGKLTLTSQKLVAGDFFQAIFRIAQKSRISEIPGSRTRLSIGLSFDVIIASHVSGMAI